MRRNSVIFLLAAIILLSCASTPRNAAAETRPLNIKSLYNMSEEDSNKKIKMDNLVFFIFVYYGKTYTLPVLHEKKKVVDDSSYVSDDDSLIGISEINESFSNSKYPYGIMTGNDVSILREVSSGEILLIIYDQYGQKTIIENEDYFKYLDIEKFERDGATGVTYYSISGYFLDSVKSFFPKTDIDYDSEITVKEIKELYEKIEKRNYWPVSEISTDKNTKLVLPQYTEEFLNSRESIKNKEISTLIVNESFGKPKLVLIHTIRVPFNPSEVSDLITGEKIDPSIVSNENKGYFKKIGIKFPFYSFDKSVLGEGTSFGNGDFEGKQLELQNLVLKMGKAETIGELLEMYSYVPEGFEPDYSNYDFSANPHVDPAWLAGQRRALRLGDRGEEVLAMKQRFYELGYFRTEKFNDQYTQNTADTVRLFEKNNGLPQDGVADAEMLALLFSDKAVGK